MNLEYVMTSRRSHYVQRIPHEFVAAHGQDLPFDCRLVMARGRQWPVRLFRIASGCHFHTGWPAFCIHNRIIDEDLFTFTLVDVGVFQVKRYKGESGCPTRSDLGRELMQLTFMIFLSTLFSIEFFTNPNFERK